MKALFSLSTLLLILYIKSFGQGEANIWYFGTKVGLDFNTVPPTPLINGSIITPSTTPGAEGEGVSSISDSDGNLLFYTDGINVYGSDHTVFPNGTGLSGHPSSAQSAIIIPKPGSTTNYYIVTAPLTHSTDGVRYSEVNMTLNGGLGDIIAEQKDIVLAGGVRMMEALCAVPHNNGTDYWLICHEGAGTNTFRMFQITSTGISAHASQNIGFTIPGGASDIGIMKSNSCYTQIAIAHHSSDLVELLDFDISTGALSNPVQITNFASGDGPYGVEFSPNGQLLYVTGLYNKVLYQFDISSGVTATINATRQTLGSAVAGADRLAAIQLGPDRKIYVANHYWGPYNNNAGSGTYLGVINNPDIAGAGANWDNDAIFFPSVLASGSSYSGVKHGLPTLLKSFVGSNLTIQTGDVCLGEAIQFSYTFSGVKTGNVTWDFGDGSPVSNLDAPTHTYTSTGTYQVQLEVTDICGRVTTSTYPVVVTDGRPDISYICSGNSITFTGNNPGTGNTGYLWYGGTGYKTSLSNTNSYVLNPATLPVSIRIYGTGGASANTSYTGHGTGYPQANSYVDFDAHTPFNLVSVKVKSENGAGGCNGTANITFSLKQGATVLQTKTVSINCGAGIQTITLNMGIPMAAGLRLESNIGFYYVAGWESGSYLWRNIPEVTYTGASHGTGGPFSDWEIKAPAGCSMTQIDLNTTNCILPVELLDFSVYKNENTSELTWITASEKNNRQFIIERSGNGLEFHPIGQIGGKGTSHQFNYYNYTDETPLPGINYYRLKQVDYDENYSYSDIRSVDFGSIRQLLVYPNPSSTGTFEIITYSEIKHIEIVNSLGQSVHDYGFINNEGSLWLDLTKKSKGVYYVRITTDETIYVKIVVKE